MNSKRRSPLTARRVYRVAVRLVLVALEIAFAVVAIRWLLSGSPFAALGFLFDPTGWDIAYSILPFDKNDPYWWAFVVGVTNTVTAGMLGIVGATVLGFVTGLAPLAGNLLLSDIARAYVDIVRNIPLILQAAFWYGIILHLPPARSAFGVFGIAYLSNRGLCVPKFADTVTVFGAVILLLVLYRGVAATWRALHNRHETSSVLWRRGIPMLTTFLAAAGLALLLPHLPGAFAIDMPVLRGLNFRGGFQIPPEFAALAAAIILYRGAYIGEIFRGGFLSVPRGQIEAAISLGLKPWMVLWKVRLPLALILIVPPLSSEYMIIVKVTSIGIVIGFADLFMVSSSAAVQTGRPIEVILVMMLIYLVLNYALSGALNVVNRRVRARGYD